MPRAKRPEQMRTSKRGTSGPRDGGQDGNVNGPSIDRWAAASLMNMGYDKSPERVSFGLLITEHLAFSPAGFSDRVGVRFKSSTRKAHQGCRTCYYESGRYRLT